MFSSSKSTFDKLLDAATSPMLMDPSWATNLELCDSIRQGDVNPKYAVAGIRKKMKDQRPLVAKYALIVLETCVKNCGQPFHEEIATQDFMEEMRLLASTGSQPVKDQVLSMMQAWNHVFRNKSQYQPILATYNLMKMEGHKFPPLNESDAMFSADAAPAWKEGDVCHMCRVKFSTFTRQHHCRACGEVFCGKCSSKSSIIPKIGMEREVRVCDHCYDEINPNAGKAESKSQTDGGGDDDDLPAEYLASDLAKEPQTKPQLSDREREAQEEEEMQLALALSLSENEANKGTSGKNWSSSTQNKPPATSVVYEEIPKSSLKSSTSNEPKPNLYAAASAQANQVDAASSELSKYLDRSYWERKNAAAATVISEPSAPHGEAEHIYSTTATAHSNHIEEEEVADGSEAFVQTMEKSIEMFVDRMNNVRMKGKHISMDTTVQSLFQSLSAMHPQLIKLMEDEEESKAKYEAMLQKLAVIREARESLNDMRAQHREKVQQQELEQEMLRRMQMEQKLELMRQQKQEYLEYQRQLQLQRQRELEHYQQEKLRQQALEKVPAYMGEIPSDPYLASKRPLPTNPAQSYLSQHPDSPPQQFNQPPKYPGQNYYPNDNPADISLDGNYNPPPSYDLAVKPSGYQAANTSDARIAGQREEPSALHIHHQNKIIRDPMDPRLMAQSYSPQPTASQRPPDQPYVTSQHPQQEYVTAPVVHQGRPGNQLTQHPASVPNNQQFSSQPPANQQSQYSNQPNQNSRSPQANRIEKSPQHSYAPVNQQQQPQSQFHQTPNSTAYQPPNQTPQHIHQPQQPNAQYAQQQTTSLPPQNQTQVIPNQPSISINQPMPTQPQNQPVVNQSPQITYQNPPLPTQNQQLPPQKINQSHQNQPLPTQSGNQHYQNQQMNQQNQQVVQQNQPPQQNQLPPQNQPLPPLNQQVNQNQQQPPINMQPGQQQPHQPAGYQNQTANQPQYYGSQQQQVNAQQFNNPQQPVSNQPQQQQGNQQFSNPQQQQFLNQQQPYGNQQNQIQQQQFGNQQQRYGNQPQQYGSQQQQYSNQQQQQFTNQQQYQQATPQVAENLSENMKDLQLISFE